MDPLAARLAQGDESAFAELYDACAERLHRYLVHRLNGPEAAADVLQETFMRMARAGGKLKHVSDPHAYIFQVARNEANRWAAKRHSSAPLEDAEITAPLINLDIAALETAEEIQAAFARLDELSREVVELKIYGDLTFKAIAAALQLPQGTVATRYRRALQQLRCTLQQESR